MDDTTFILIDPPNSITVEAQVTGTSPGQWVMPGLTSLALDGIYTREMQANENGDGTYTIVFNVPISEALISACESDNELALVADASFNPGSPVPTLNSGLVSIPCSIVRMISPDLVPPSITEICGAQNDEVTPSATQSEGVIPEPVVSEWDGNTKTLTYKAAPGYQFAVGFDPVIEVTDDAVICPELSYSWEGDGLATVVPGLPEYLLIDITLPEGHEYDTLSYVVSLERIRVPGSAGSTAIQPGVVHQQVRVELNTNGNWAYVCDRWRSLYIDSRVESEVNPGLPPISAFENDVYSCRFADSIEPEFEAVVQTAICGPNNDTFATTQENVEISVGDWEGNSVSVELAADTGYYFPNGAVTTRQFTDANEPCPPNTSTITVTFEPSDGGSIAGTPYQLFAPVASMQHQPAFAEGVIGADNTITIDGLIAGTYRLVTAPQGYDPIDIMLDVVDGDNPQMFTVQVAAVQIPETPTPKPTNVPTTPPTAEPTSTVSPTSEPTATVDPTATVPPTTEPTVTPTPGATGTPVAGATTAPGEPPTAVTGVSGLPNTGSGGTQSTLLLGDLAAAALLLMLASRLRTTGR